MTDHLRAVAAGVLLVVGLAAAGASIAATRLRCRNVAPAEWA